MGKNCGLIISLILAAMAITASNAQYNTNYYNPYGLGYGYNSYGTGSYGGYNNPYNYYGLQYSQYPYSDYSYLFNLYNSYRNSGYPTQYGNTNGLVFSGK